MESNLMELKHYLAMIRTFTTYLYYFYKLLNYIHQRAIENRKFAFFLCIQRQIYTIKTINKFIP